MVDANAIRAFWGAAVGGGSEIHEGHAMMFVIVG